MSFEPVDLERAATGPGGLFYGVYPALVVDLQDPDNQGRVLVRLPGRRIRRIAPMRSGHGWRC